MEERLLRFARIVDVGSFTKAAHDLHISQPALTTAVKKLERELASELIIRGSRGFTLTAAGQLAYESAKQIYADAQNLRLRLAEQAGHKTTLRVGLIDSIADMLFVQSSSLEELEQTTRASLTVDNSARLIELVEHDQLDVALIARPARLAAALHAQDVGSEPLIFVCGSKNIAAVKKELSQKRLWHFLCYNQASRTFQLIDAHFAGHGITLQPSFYSTSPEIMLQLVLAGRGAAVLPYSLVKPHLKSQKLTPLPMGTSPTIARQIVQVRRTSRALPVQAQSLTAQAQRRLKLLTKEAEML